LHPRLSNPPHSPFPERAKIPVASIEPRRHHRPGGSMRRHVCDCLSRLRRRQVQRTGRSALHHPLAVVPASRAGRNDRPNRWASVYHRIRRADTAIGPYVKITRNPVGPAPRAGRIDRPHRYTPASRAPQRTGRGPVPTSLTPYPLYPSYPHHLRERTAKPLLPREALQ